MKKERHFLLSLILLFRLKMLLKKEKFVFFYQPQYDLKTKKITGVEALIRLKKGKKIVSPDAFIPFLEKTGKIKLLTPFLLDQTLSDLKKIHASGFKKIKLAINLSPIQLHQENLGDLITAQLKKFDLPRSVLECEITETSLIKDNSTQIATLSNIKKKGIAIALDDFGSGYASFDYLRKFNIDTLKIDRQFIKTLSNNHQNGVIVKAIIQLGHQLKLTVLAEGIETKEQEKWLIQNKCEQGQGFLFAKPMPLDELICFLKKH